MNFKKYTMDNSKCLTESIDPVATIKPTETADKVQMFKPGSIKDNVKFFDGLPVKIVDKQSDSQDQIWIELLAGNDKGTEKQVLLGDLKANPTNPQDTIVQTNESTTKSPEEILKSVFNFLTKKEDDLKDKKDIEMFNKIKNIMTVYKKTKHLTSSDIDFLNKEVAPLFEEELLLGDKDQVEENWRPGRHDHKKQVWVGKTLDDAGWRKGTWNPSNKMWRYEGKLKDNDELLHDDDQDMVMIKSVSQMNPTETFIGVHEPVDEPTKRAFDKYVAKNYGLRNT